MFDEVKPEEAIAKIIEVVEHIDREGPFRRAQEVPIPVSLLRAIASLGRKAPPLDEQTREALRVAIREGRGADAESFHRLWLATQDKKNT